MIAAHCRETRLCFSGFRRRYVPDTYDGMCAVLAHVRRAHAETPAMFGAAEGAWEVPTASS